MSVEVDWVVEVSSSCFICNACQVLIECMPLKVRSDGECD